MYKIFFNFMEKVVIFRFIEFNESSAFFLYFNVGTFAIIPPATPVPHTSEIMDTDCNCSCSLVNTSQPLDEARPSKLFVGDTGTSVTSYLMKVCTPTCTMCRCTAANFEVISFQEVIGGRIHTKDIPRSCDCQCK